MTSAPATPTNLLKKATISTDRIWYFISFLCRVKYMDFKGLFASIHSRYIDRKDGRRVRGHATKAVS